MTHTRSEKKHNQISENNSVSVEWISRRNLLSKRKQARKRQRHENKRELIKQGLITNEKIIGEFETDEAWYTKQNHSKKTLSISKLAQRPISASTLLEPPSLMRAASRSLEPPSPIRSASRSLEPPSLMRAASRSLEPPSLMPSSSKFIEQSSPMPPASPLPKDSNSTPFTSKSNQQPISSSVVLRSSPQPILKKPGFNKLLYYFLSFLFFFPGYLYKKNYETNYQRYLAEKKHIAQNLKLAPEPKLQSILKNNSKNSSKEVFTAEELKRIYINAGITDDSDTNSDNYNELKKESESPQSTHLCNYFCCFFNNSNPKSAKKDKNIYINTRLSR